jgi:TetR/AcrR family transcriptional repressor of nem operon
LRAICAARLRTRQPFQNRLLIYAGDFMRVQTARTDTADRILDLAERLVQTRGFNGFSYADIASELGVTKASLHYHFPTKAELGLRLIERYSEAFMGALAGVDETAIDAREKLRIYADIYSGVLHDNRMCLCGMLAADYATLPNSMKDAVTQFFDLNERWLAAVLEQGRSAGDLHFAGESLEVARLLVSSLEGAMLLARSFGDVSRFQSITDRLLGDLRTSHQLAAPAG